MAKAMGREIATGQDARELLGLKGLAGVSY